MGVRGWALKAHTLTPQPNTILHAVLERMVKAVCGAWVAVYLPGSALLAAATFLAAFTRLGFAAGCTLAVAFTAFGFGFSGHDFS